MKKYLFEFYIKKEFIYDFEEKIKKIKQKSALESGCIFFDYFIMEKTFIILEYWKSEADLNEHRKQNYLSEFRNEIKEMTSEKRKMHEAIEILE